jgi:hypothetical protein
MNNQTITYNIFLSANEAPIIQFYFHDAVYWFPIEHEKGHIDEQAFKRRLLNEFQRYSYADFEIKLMFSGKISKSDYLWIRKSSQAYSFLNSSNLRGA